MTIPPLAILVIAAVFLAPLVLFMLARHKISRQAVEISKIRTDAENGLKAAQALVDQERSELENEKLRIKKHYEDESQKAQAKSESLLSKAFADLESLKKFQSLLDAESQTKHMIADAVEQAKALRADAQTLLDAAKNAAEVERIRASNKVDELLEQADQAFKLSARNAAKVIEEAHKNAEKIAGDAYTAMREKDALEQAAKAIRNLIEGYGDKYVIPTRGVIDDLANGFGHTEAGTMLKSAKEFSESMVTQGLAATCDYAEENRRETAVRFVISSFNGRVQPLLANAERDNIGTVEQEIRDVFHTVNHDGSAFRNARVQPAYLDACLSVLKWTVAVKELKDKAREEQRRIKEQMREEEKARREYERAIRESEEEEQRLKKAMAVAREEVQHATAQEREKYEAQLSELTAQLKAAEEKNQRALSMAQQTRKGNVYIISNVGSFGEEVFKIGMTRRLIPEDRIWELSDASVPFDFDIHAMIPCDDAPSLEYLLHSSFEDQRINKVNYRKEFFRVPLERIRAIVAERGIAIEFTALAAAHEYRETLKLEGMSKEEREKYLISRDEGLDDEN